MSTKKADRIWRSAHNIQTYGKVVEVLEKVNEGQLSLSAALRTHKQYLAVHERKYDHAKKDL